jgi:hypothetical protein
VEGLRGTASALACNSIWNGPVSRRAALKGAALGAISLMACSHGARAAESHITSTFGSGFCNLNFYLANAMQTAQSDGLILDFVPTPTFAEQVTFLGAGQVDAGLMLHTSLVAQPGLDTPANLKGKTVGTFQLDTLVGRYYKTSMENARIAMSKQPSVVDARSQTQFILDWVNSIQDIGHIKKKPGRESIDWTFLEQVIAENADLYGKLKYKSA